MTHTTALSQALQEVALVQNLSPEARLLLRAQEPRYQELLRYARQAPEIVLARVTTVVVEQLQSEIGGESELWQAYLGLREDPQAPGPQAADLPPPSYPWHQEARPILDRLRALRKSRGWSATELTRELNREGFSASSSTVRNLLTPAAARYPSCPVARHRLPHLAEALGALEKHGSASLPPVRRKAGEWAEAASPVIERLVAVRNEQGWTNAQLGEALARHGFDAPRATMATLLAPSALRLRTSPIAAARYVPLAAALDALEDELTRPAPQAAMGEEPQVPGVTPPQTPLRVRVTLPGSHRERVEAVRVLMEANARTGGTTTINEVARVLKVKVGKANDIIRAVPGSVHIGGGRWRLAS